MKKEQEETKAAEILGLGERQKTIVMEKQKVRLGLIMTVADKSNWLGSTSTLRTKDSIA